MRTTLQVQTRHISRHLQVPILYEWRRWRANLEILDGSGWAWFIPRYDGTTSIGVVMNQDLADSKKEFCSSIEQFYTTSLKLAPNLSLLLGDGELVTDVKSASDYSYNSSAYAIPYDSNKLTQAELCKTFDFSTYASEPAPAEIRTKTVKKVSFALDDDSDTNTAYEEKKALLHANPIDGEERRSKKIRPRNIMGVEDAMGIDAFKMNLINGLAPGLRRGSLGLPSSPRPLRKPRRYSV